EPEHRPAGRPPRPPWAMAGGSLALAVLLGAGLGAGQGFIGDRHRFDAHSLVDPPVQIDDELSPMTPFRWTKDAVHQDDEVFSVTFDEVPTGSATAPTRIALAYLSSYDGSVWSVGPDELHRAGDRLPAAPGTELPGGASITQHYSIDPALP